MTDADHMYAQYFGHARSSPPENEFEKLTVDYLFGTLYARATEARIRDPLGLRDRALINVAVLATLGRLTELRQHLEAAVYQGFSHDELIEVMIHLAHYSGWPAGHSAMKVLNDMQPDQVASEMSDTQRQGLRELNENIAQWEQRRDEEAIRQLRLLLSPRLLFHRSDGTVVTKDQFLLGLQDKSPFRQRSSEDLVIKVIGARACALLTVVTTKHSDEVRRYRNVRFFAFTGGRWQLESWFNYELRDDALEDERGRGAPQRP